MITAAYGAGNCRETFGATWRVAIKSSTHSIRKPAVLKEFNDAVAKKVDAQTTKDAKTHSVEENVNCKGPCHFGHISSSQRANGREVMAS